jgi:elongation factor G
MDRVGADFEMTLASLRRHFPDHVVAPVQRPLGAESAFTGLEDLVTRRTVRFGDPDDPRDFTVSEGLSDAGEAARRALVEAVADHDDPTAEAVLEERDVPPDALRAAVRRVTLAGTFVPLLAGSALRNRGIPQVLDAICAYRPSPLDVPPPTGHDPQTGAEVRRPVGDAAPLLALAFKVSLLDERRRHVFLRVYAGRIAEGEAVWNASQGKFEKIGRVLLMHAAHKERVPALGAGQIFAVAGLKETRTGDTPTAKSHPVLLERLSSYEPVISQAIEAGSQKDRELLLEALARVADEDPTFRYGEDPDTGQLLFSGMGELHLEIVAERLRREFHLSVRTGPPQVLLRETLSREAEGAATFARTLEDGELFGQVSVRVGPLPRGGGFRFVVAPEVSSLPFLRDEVRRMLEDGAREAAEAGALEGHPLQDVQVTVTGATWREGASKPFTYKIACADAVRDAAPRAGPMILEPLMRLEIVAPAEHLGEVIGSVDRRKGTVLDVSERGAAVKVIEGEAPLRRLFGYATELRSLSQGRALFTMKFDRYDAVP